MAAIAFYDKNRAFISALNMLTPGSQRGTIKLTTNQIPSNTYYIRVSGAWKESSDSAPSKIDYKAVLTLDEEVYQLDASLQLQETSITSLDNRVTALENSEETVKTIKFKSFEGTDTLSPDENMLLLANKVRVNTLLTAYIEGSIEDIEVGVGYSNNSSFKYRTYDARWIELTQTQVKLYGYYNGDHVLHKTYNHGLTLTDKTTIYVITTLIGNDSDSTSTLLISTDDGSAWTQELPSWGQGSPFAHNKNTTGDITVNLKFQPRDITKNIWVFGDSYFSHIISYLY